MAAITGDVTILSNRPAWATQVREWLGSLASVRDCQVETLPVFNQTSLGSRLLCIDGCDSSALSILSWPHEILANSSAILVLPDERHSQWEEALSRFDWDCIPAAECTSAFLSFALHARWRLQQSHSQIEDYARRFSSSVAGVGRLLAQADVLANMSHEIRTPLNTIVGMSDLLMDSHIHGVEKKHLEVIKKSSQALLGLVENILDLSRLQTGRLAFESSAFALHDLIEQVIDMISPRAHKKGLETILEIDATVPLFVTADKTRLQQVLSNLLINAVTFTEKGQVWVKSWVEFAPSRSCLHFLIQDTGPGLTLEQIHRLDGLSSMVEPSMLKTQNGPGLGLPLARQFVEGMGGQFEVQTGHEGSAFHFSLPIQIEPSTSMTQKMKKELHPVRSKRVLILDHHADSSRVLQMYLREAEMTSEVFEQPQDFLSCLLHFQNGYDLAFIDYETAGPQLSGWISQAVGLPKGLRVVILLKSNAHTWSRAPRRKSTLGIHHLLKPVKRCELISVLQNVFLEDFPSGRNKAPVELLPRARADENFRILVVDDSKDNRYLMQALLRDSFHATWFAENGRVAVEMARDHRYDLIFMDLQMPEMDGVTATRLIRAAEKEKGELRTPILALTAHVQGEERSRALQAGCDDYLTKPITKQVILDAIERVRRSQNLWRPPQSLYEI